MATKDKKYVLGFIKGKSLHLVKSIQGERGNGIKDIVIDEQEGDGAVNTVTFKTMDNSNGIDLHIKNGNRGNGIIDITEDLSNIDGGTNYHIIHTTDGDYVIQTKNGKTGAQGITAVYDSEYPVSELEPYNLETTTGQSQSTTMTQKAITDELDSISSDIYDYEESGETSVDLSLSVTLNSSGEGKYVIWDTGNIYDAASENLGVTGYINIEGYYKIDYSRVQTSQNAAVYGIAFYSEKNVESHISGKQAKLNAESLSYTEDTVNVPEGAKYVRMTIGIDSSTWGDPVLIGYKKTYTKTPKLASIAEDIEANVESIEAINSAVFDYEKTGSEEVADLSDLITHYGEGINIITVGTTSSGSQLNDATDYIDISGYDGIKYSRISKSTATNLKIGICFYNENKLTHGNDPKWGQEAIPDDSATDYVLTEIEVPKGAKYVRMTIRKASAGWSTPVLKGLRYIYTKTPKLTTIENDLQSISDGVSEVDNEVFEYIKGEIQDTIDLTEYVTHYASGKFVYKTGELTNAEKNDATNFIDIGGYDTIKYSRNQRSNSKQYWGIAFYAADKVTCVGYQLANYVKSPSSYTLAEVEVPNGAKYVRMTIRKVSEGWGAPVLYGLKYNYIKKSKIDEIQEKIENVDKGIFPPLIGVPQPYLFTPTEDVGMSIFSHVDDIYDAYDALVEQYPRWMSKEENIGMDATNTYEVRHYTLRYQTPSVKDSRSNAGTNLWNDETFPMRRILLMTGIHALEQYSTLGTYMAVKAICESNEPWAQFIKANAIIDIIPIVNPWGLENKNTPNVNGNWNASQVNLNRDYNSNPPQVETQNVIDLIQSLIPLNLGGIVDMHNCGDTHNDAYIVTSKNYKEYKYYARLAQQLNVLMGSQLDTAFGTSNPNHLHAWTSIDNGSLQTGQGHWYADKCGILGITCEARTTGTIHYRSSCISSMMAVNSIIAFIQKMK